MKKIILFAMTLLMLVACSNTTSTDVSGEWKLVSYGDVNNPTPAIADVETSIKFENGQMSGNVGCNGFGGGYSVNGNKITFDSIMSTMMFCEGISDQEQAVLAVFSNQVELAFQISGDTLTITSADGASIVNLARK